MVHERAPPEDSLRGFFLDQIRTDSDRYSEEKNNVRQHPFTHSYSESGRWRRFTRELLSSCGIKVNLHTQRLIALAENMPIDILRVRDDDIPGLVMDGVVDLALSAKTC